MTQKQWQTPGNASQHPAGACSGYRLDDSMLETANFPSVSVVVIKGRDMTPPSIHLGPVLARRK